MATTKVQFDATYTARTYRLSGLDAALYSSDIPSAIW